MDELIHAPITWLTHTLKKQRDMLALLGLGTSPLAQKSKEPLSGRFWSTERNFALEKNELSIPEPRNPFPAAVRHRLLCVFGNDSTVSEYQIDAAVLPPPVFALVAVAKGLTLAFVADPGSRYAFRNEICPYRRRPAPR